MAQFRRAKEYLLNLFQVSVVSGSDYDDQETLVERSRATSYCPEHDTESQSPVIMLLIVLIDELMHRVCSVC